jgi:hypothetical protein
LEKVKKVSKSTSAPFGILDHIIAGRSPVKEKPSNSQQKDKANKAKEENKKK